MAVTPYRNYEPEERVGQTKDTLTNRLRETQHLIGAIREAVAKLESQITGQTYNSLATESQKRAEPAGLNGLVMDNHSSLMEIQERLGNINGML